MVSPAKAWLLSGLLFCVHTSQACINDGGKLRENPGKAYGRVAALEKALETSPAVKLAALKTGWEKAVGGNTSQQKAVELILCGDITGAIEYLRNLEAAHPGTYETAANLGTALELNGEPEEALQWINEGISRNPESHEGSEWVHAKILEAKIALKSDPDWLKTNSVIEARKRGAQGFYAMNEKDELSLSIGTNGPAIRSAVYYQLRERLVFVKTQDAIVADLLKLLARLEDEMGQPENGIPLLKLGQKFGLSPDFVHGKINNYKEQAARIQWNKVSAYLYPSLAFIFVAALGVAFFSAIFSNPFRRKKAATMNHPATPAP